MEPKPVIELYDFLVESELQQYYNAIKNELKITLVPHLKYASDEDLKQVGLSKPEIRRLRKFYEKYYPHGYLSKIKRLLQNPAGKREEVGTLNNASSTETLKTISSPSKLPSNKHIIPADSICVNKQLGVGEFGIVQQGVWTNGNERAPVEIVQEKKYKVKEYPDDIQWSFLRDVPSSPEQELFEIKNNFYSVYRWQEYQNCPTIDSESDGTIEDKIARDKVENMKKKSIQPRAVERVKNFKTNKFDYVYKAGNSPPDSVLSYVYPADLTMEMVYAICNLSINAHPIEFENTYTYYYFDEFLDPRSSRYTPPNTDENN